MGRQVLKSLKKDTKGVPDNSTELESIDRRIPVHTGLFAAKSSFNAV